MHKEWQQRCSQARPDDSEMLHRGLEVDRVVSVFPTVFFPSTAFKMNIFTTLLPGRVVGRRLFSSYHFPYSGLYSRRVPSATFSTFPQPASFNTPFIRAYSRIPGTDPKKNENSFISEKDTIKTSTLTPESLMDEEPYYPITLPPSFMTEILERVLDVSICHPPLPLVKSGDDRIRFFDPVSPVTRLSASYHHLLGNHRMSKPSPWTHDVLPWARYK